ncbi:uncharacterized protein Z520_09162 [Fonsecaea multimorphosa CBS 102226]|uniref:FAD-binding domain-containing protein n=1 Tax=Fonsecaea multimorphosa CBS 102226 TaxID=1442371 RepID=A0A0D2H0A0_9EURO|nr:uncharacterized protein Z520_09162 [Fonsecaea multimorphosa CBS 102226]KIX95245.1 hypothetical protein Z520_09162 [Fonsecaea multimorphosa CBS 102226]OAL17263.1 hypothetical protein AYO22_11828 [Fonsecaea multimorphosa]
MIQKNPDVVVVGAGPTGLWVAAELTRAKLDVVIIEAVTTRDPRSRAVGMAAGTLETFATRGVAEQFVDSGVPISSVHFGAASTRLQITEELLGTKYPYSICIPQVVTENILTEHCAAMGMHIRWGQRVVGLSQTGDAVTVTMESSSSERSTVTASWVIGCDGGRSSVRQYAGIEFPGTSSTITGWLADVLLKDPPGHPVSVRGPTGSLLVQRMGKGDYYRMAGVDVETKHFPTSAPPTLEQICGWAKTLYGTDFGAHSPVWLSRYGNATRLASSLRHGRVFIAGDAAHQFFPAGGQGINTGLQDATNLAWRIAAVRAGRVTGMSAEQLLDGYSTERRLAASQVILSTGAGLSAFMASEPYDIALVTVFSEALEDKGLNGKWALRMTGFGDPFPQASVEQDPLIEARLTHVKFQGAFDNLHRRMTVTNFVLIVLDPVLEQTMKQAVKPWKTWITLISSEDKPSAYGDQWKGVTGILVRPDARVAWVGRSSPDKVEGLAATMQSYVGDGELISAVL